MNWKIQVKKISFPMLQAGCVRFSQKPSGECFAFSFDSEALPGTVAVFGRGEGHVIRV